jgi:hypothetical protein
MRTDLGKKYVFNMEDGWNLLRILSIIGFGYVLC